MDVTRRYDRRYDLADEEVDSGRLSAPERNADQSRKGVDLPSRSTKVSLSFRPRDRKPSGTHDGVRKMRLSILEIGEMWVRT